MSQEHMNEENDISNEFCSSESYLATFEAAIQQLQKIMENPQNGQKMTPSQNQQQLQILSQKYEKIEQLVYIEQEQIEDLINSHVALQKELNNEYSLHQNVIVQGKREILQLTLANKQALQIQNNGQRTLESNQQEAERIVQYIQKLQKDISSLNVIMQDKQKEESILDSDNIKYQNSIDEFRKDQSEQKEELEGKKSKIMQVEKSVKQIRKEQFDTQKKMDSMKKTAQEIEHKTNSFINEHEIALSELRNEKRTLLVSDKKLEEIEKGLKEIQQQIELSNQHLDQIRELNKNMKAKVHQVENAVMIYSSEGPQSEELQTLENLLAEYNQLLGEKQKVYQNKEQEKALLTEHLQQMNNFAQQYLEKQQQNMSSQNDNQLSSFTNKLEQSDQVHTLEEGKPTNNTQQNSNNSQAFGMECIQSQYEQEQDSQATANIQSLNIISQHQSKQSQSSQNHQIYLDQILMPANTFQNQHVESEKQQLNEGKGQDSLLQQQIEEQQMLEQQQHHQEQYELHQQLQEQLQQQQFYQQQQQKNDQVNADNLTNYKQQSHLNQDSLTNHELQTQDIAVVNQSFGNPISASLQESPVQVQRIQNNNAHLDYDQQQIASEFANNQVSLDQQKLQEFIQQQEQNESSPNENMSENHSAKQSSSKNSAALSEQSQRMMIKMGLPGMGGYKNIMNQLKSNFQNEQQQ